MTQTPPLLPTY